MRRGPLRSGAFRRLYAAQSLSVIGDGVVPVALSFGVLSLTDSPAMLGVALAARAIAQVACFLPAGALADRLPRSRVILLSALVRAIGQAILGLLFIKGVGALWAIVLIQMVNGAASAFDRPAAVGLIPTLVQPSDVQPANALLSLSQSIGLIAGPAIAAVIIATAGAGWTLLLDAASFAAAVLLLARLPAGVAPRRAPQGLLADIREGGRALVRRAWLLLA